MFGNIDSNIGNLFAVIRIFPQIRIFRQIFEIICILCQIGTDKNPFFFSVGSFYQRMFAVRRRVFLYDFLFFLRITVRFLIVFRIIRALRSCRRLLRFFSLCRIHIPKIQILRTKFLFRLRYCSFRLCRRFLLLYDFRTGFFVFVIFTVILHDRKQKNQYKS